MTKKKLNLISFNVNGIRACLKKGFLDFIENENPDIFCLNETKINENFLEEELKIYPYKFYNFADKKGYSGTAIFSKIKPINVFYGLKNFESEVSDGEGRVVTAEFENFFLISVYTPNSKQKLERLDYRTKVWDKHFLDFITNLKQKKEVIVCGDLNVAHKEIDLKNPKTNRRNPGFTDEERNSFQKYIDKGFIDTFRFLNPEKIKYSWWSYFHNSRAKNIGWRIDYFLASQNLKENLIEADILNEVLGSDHCPVKLIIEI